MQARSAVSSLRTTLVVVLLAAAVAELLVTIGVLRGNDSSQTLAGLNLPGSFVTLTVAVVFATLAPPGRVLRALVAVCAVAFAGVRLGVAGALVVAEPDVPEFMMTVIPGRVAHTSVGMAVVTGSVLGLALAVWACMEFLRPLRASAPVLHRTLGNVHPVPARPLARPTPSAAHPYQWRRATTPWPRAVEGDPNGTLIRPRPRG